MWLGDDRERLTAESAKFFRGWRKGGKGITNP